MNSYSLAKEDTKILLVDNHAEKCVELEEKLNQPGYCVVKAQSSSEGFSHLLQQEFALILLHLLPEKSEAVDLIQKWANLLEIPILVV